MLAAVCGCVSAMGGAWLADREPDPKAVERKRTVQEVGLFTAPVLSRPTRAAGRAGLGEPETDGVLFMRFYARRPEGFEDAFVDAVLRDAFLEATRGLDAEALLATRGSIDRVIEAAARAVPGLELRDPAVFQLHYRVSKNLRRAHSSRVVSTR